MTVRLSSEAEVDYIESMLFYLTEESLQSAERFTNELEKSYKEIYEAPYRNRAIEFGLKEKCVKGISILRTLYH
jgi:plasmid stabilization system protein ParE